MEAVAEWFMGVDDLPGWAQAVATLLTGGLAIYAAKLALRGARKQADAVLETQRLQQAQQSMAIARGLQAEAMDIFIRLTANRYRLEDSDPDDKLADLFVPLDLSFYAANLGHLGLLQPGDIHLVMPAFKRAARFQAELDSLLAKPITVGEVQRLVALVKRTIGLVLEMRVVYVELSLSAGSTKEIALEQIEIIDKDTEAHNSRRARSRASME